MLYFGSRWCGCYYVCSRQCFIALVCFFSRVMTIMGTIENCSGVLNDVLNGLASVSVRDIVLCLWYCISVS